MTQTYQGMAASPGVAIGPVWVYHTIDVRFDCHTITDTSKEWERIENALKQCAEELEALKERALQMAGADEAEIFEAHSLFLSDPELLNKIRTFIFEQSMNAESAVADSIENFAQVMESMDNEYFKARAMDIRDVGNRVIRCLCGVSGADIQMPNFPVIVLAEDLTPSDTVQFDKDVLLGICTVKGGPTSHTAILSRSLGIPAVVRAPIEINTIENNICIIIDGESGDVIIDPDAAQIETCRAQQVREKSEWDGYLKNAHDGAVTQDGLIVEVVANIGSADDARKAVEYGAEGVGLLRTEFLYLDRSCMPAEEEQIKIYRQIFDVMERRPIVVRTLDIGGDKEVSYLGTRHESNPFLGWRAIRMIVERPDILSMQLRAILQAGLESDLRIMLPMVSNLDEILLARKIMDDVCRELSAEKIAYAKKVQFGIMVEVPSAALMADELADYVDFFSIGTNDLTQYTLAVDRTNERVAPIASPFHPAVIRLIARTIEAAHQKGKWVGLCGEMAGDVLATELLLGLGLDEFSMAATSIPRVKYHIRQCRLDACKTIAEKALKMTTTKEVIDLLSP